MYGNECGETLKSSCFHILHVTRNYQNAFPVVTLSLFLFESHILSITYHMTVLPSYHSLIGAERTYTAASYLYVRSIGPQRERTELCVTLLYPQRKEPNYVLLFCITP
jgi:hypothetical protein